MSLIHHAKHMEGKEIMQREGIPREKKGGFLENNKKWKSSRGKSTFERQTVKDEIYKLEAFSCAFTDKATELTFQGVGGQRYGGS